MRKTLALLLALAMLFTLALPAMAEDAELKRQEIETVLAWMTQDLTTEEDAISMLDWDRETVLEKLEGYDEPLQYNTKEEIADQFVAVLSMFKLFQGAAESDDGGEAASQLVAGLFGGLGGLFGEDEDYTGDYGFDFGDDETGNWSHMIADIFNTTFWESEDAQLEMEFEEGLYRAIVTAGEEETSFLCAYDEFDEDERYFERLTSEDSTDTFVFDGENMTITWTDADGAQTTFARIIDPLDGAQYFADNCLMTFYWKGDVNYEVYIEQYIDFVVWNYECVLDSDADTLTGVGHKSQYGDDFFAEDEAVFTFENARNQLVWTSSEKEEDAPKGETFEHIERYLIYDNWAAEDGTWLSCTWMNGYYWAEVFDAEGNAHGYLCLYDRDSSTLVSVDISELDLEALNFYLDEEVFASSGSFEMLDDENMLWRDDAGATGEDGVVLTNNW